VPRTNTTNTSETGLISRLGRVKGGTGQLGCFRERTGVGVSPFVGDEIMLGGKKDQDRSSEIEVKISNKLNSRNREENLNSLLKEIEMKLESGARQEEVKINSLFRDTFAQDKSKDEILKQPLDRPFSYTAQKTVMMASGQNRNLGKALASFKPTYEEGEGIVSISDIFARKIENIQKTKDHMVNASDKELLQATLRAVDQVSVRGSMVEGNSRLIRNIVMLSKFFSDRLSYLIDLRQDQFGMLYKLPLRFIIFLNNPANISIKKQFISGGKDASRDVQSENNLYFPENSTKVGMMAAVRNAVGGGGSNDTAAIKRGKHNKKLLSRSEFASGTGVSSSKPISYNFEESAATSNAEESALDGNKKKEKRKQENKGKADLKSILKPRQKLLLKKFVRIHLLQFETPELLRRPSFELMEEAPNLPAASTLESSCMFNRKNFSFTEDKRKRDMLRMKKINKLEFKPFNMKRVEEDEVTQFSMSHWKKAERDPKKLEKKLALEFANGSIVSSNIRAKLLINHPSVIYSGKADMNTGKPGGWSTNFVILIGFRLYVYSNADSKKADVVFELEPRDLEKGMSPSPGWFALHNSYQDPLFFSMEKEGPKLLKYLDVVIGYECVVHMYEQIGKIKYLNGLLTDFYSDPFEPRYINNYDEDMDNQTTNDVSITENPTKEMQSVIYMTLKPIKYHKNLTELTIINISLSSRAVRFLFEAIHYVKPRLKVLRLEYNDFGPEAFNECIVEYTRSPLFFSLDVLSVSGNPVGDSCVEALLNPISKKLETELFQYGESAVFPIGDLRMSNCGLTGRCLPSIDEYAKSLEKIRIASKSSELRFKLDISRNEFVDEAMIEIINILWHSPVVTSLNLAESYMMSGPGLIKFFGCLSHVESLEELNLSELYITEPMVPFVQRMLYRNPHLHKVKLSFEKFSFKTFLSSKRPLTKYYGMIPDIKPVFGNKNYKKVQIFNNEEEGEVQIKYNYKLGMKREQKEVVEVNDESRRGRKYR
jgi:hypothetical protein